MLNNAKYFVYKMGLLLKNLFTDSEKCVHVKWYILTICDSILCFKKRQNAIIICFIIKHYKQALFDGLKRVKALVFLDFFSYIRGVLGALDVQWTSV